MDAGWSKSANKNNYTALAASCPAIDKFTNKIINITIVNKYCKDCNI